MPKIATGKRSFLSVRNLTKVPANLTMARHFIHAVNWNDAANEVQSELQTKVAIVGQPNTGKSTLFNTLKGQQLSEVSSQAGTTKSLIQGSFGPYTLIDTPGHLPDIQMLGIESAGVVIFMIDGTKGLQKSDRELYQKIKQGGKPVIIAVNKMDVIKANPVNLADDIGIALNGDAIPISASAGTNVAEELIPTLIDLSPEAALVLGRELPQFRRSAATKLIRTAALISLAAGAEPIPLIDIPILLGTQIRLVLRIGTLYGEPSNSKHTKVVIATIAGGLAMRYLAEQAAKSVPIGGDLVSAAVAAASTWSIGEVAVRYFETGKQLSAKEMREMYKNIFMNVRGSITDLLKLNKRDRNKLPDEISQ